MKRMNLALLVTIALLTKFIEVKSQSLKLDKLNVFTYKNQFNEMDSFNTYLKIKGDSIFETSFGKTCIWDSSSQKKNETQQITRIDTFIVCSVNRINRVKGRKFIDLNAPNIPKNNLSTVWLNNYLFIKSKTKAGDKRIIEFSNIDAFHSESQYSYFYLEGFWIIRYEFNSNRIYNLTRINRALCK
jgi:hypothetical protein